MSDIEPGVQLTPDTIAAMERLRTPPPPPRSTMSTPHKATPSDWAWLEGNSTVDRCDAAWSRGLIELRARVEALEGKYETQRLATLEWGKDVEILQRWSDQHLQRIMALEAAQQQPEPIDEEENDRRFHACMDLIRNATPEQIRAAAGLPERSALVERVDPAAIREVADWLDSIELHVAAARLRQEIAD